MTPDDGARAADANRRADGDHAADGARPADALLFPDDLTERFRAARRDPALAVLEGLHALKHALRFGADILETWTRDAAELDRLARRLAPDVADAIVGGARPLDRAGFAELAPSPHPTGVIALARRPAVDIEAILAGPDTAPVILLERPTHHGNIGAVVRVAAAAGAAGVLVTGPHDPWHPASLRGGAGLQFALPVASLEPDGPARAAAAARPVVALDPAGEALTTRRGPGAREVVRGRAPVEAAGAEAVGEEAGSEAAGPTGLAGSLLVFGSERTGVSPGLLERADRVVALPMRPGVSSLNLATAVAAVLYLAGAPFGGRL